MMRKQSLLLAIVLWLTAPLCFAQGGPSDLSHADNTTQLELLQLSLDDKLAERARIRTLLNTSEIDDKADQEAKLTAINTEIKGIRDAFEQLAIGSVEMDIFSEQQHSFDWREEVTQIMMPVVENLKALTEKPRKIELLKAQISLKQEQLNGVNTAISSINENTGKAETDASKATLKTVLQSWKSRQTQTLRDLELAKTQLDRLQNSSEPWFQSLRRSTLDFLKGRGLTLLIAIFSSVLVWYIMRTALRFFESRSQSGNRKNFRTRQRLARYAFKILTALMIAVTLMIVFYIRGDMLLMALSFLFVVAAVLGLRNTVTKFVAETRLLLNIGSVREDERVMYNGIPWQIVSLNVFSILRNPELTGVIRLPLESLNGMVSRPAGEEVWFPTSKGDYILLDGEKLMHVASQTPERVELENLVGTKTTLPTSDFYNLTFDNLSRGKSFAVVSEFGIDYRHQDQSVEIIPQALLKAVRHALAKSDLADKVEDVAVELKAAGASSLDFWVCVTLSSSAARAYIRLSRLIQQTCVKTCTDENWEIPFPQLTLHQA